MRNCIEKDVVITVDKCRKERRNRNSRRLMTPSISFYTSCDVTKHQPSFPFWAFDAYSRVKSVHLERRLACFVRVYCVRACWEYEDSRYQTSISDMESKRVPKGREANGPPGFRALLLLWLMTCDPLALNICHLFIMDNLRRRKRYRLKLEANILNAYHEYWKRE